MHRGDQQQIDLYFLVRTVMGQPSMGNTQRPWYACARTPSASCLLRSVTTACDPAIPAVHARHRCWISSQTNTTQWSLAGSLEQFVFFYLPLILLLMYNVAVYVFLFRHGVRAGAWCFRARWTVATTLPARWGTISVPWPRYAVP